MRRAIEDLRQDHDCAHNRWGLHVKFRTQCAVCHRVPPFLSLWVRCPVCHLNRNAHVESSAAETALCWHVTDAGGIDCRDSPDRRVLVQYACAHDLSVPVLCPANHYAPCTIYPCCLKLKFATCWTVLETNATKARDSMTAL